VRSSGSKREKDIARQKAERQAARRAEREAKQKRQAIIGGFIAIVIVALLIGLVAWAPWKGSGTVANPTPTAQPTTPAPTPTPTVQIAGCTTAPAIRTDNLDFKTPPPYNATAGTVLNLNTNCGLIAIQTEIVKAPGTSANMLGLAQAGYFDLTKCHRLVNSGIYVLQCGDPKGDGTGGPSYTIKDENLPKGTGSPAQYVYPAGTVAMANRGANTGSSQFFIVYKDSPLGPNYAVWGHVTKGLDQVQAIGAAGVQGGGSDGPPAQPVVIKTATVSKN
jgi:peptidyl-prolyl cis-trans isomerase B (cyclophilin B)